MEARCDAILRDCIPGLSRGKDKDYCMPRFCVVTGSRRRVSSTAPLYVYVHGVGWPRTSHLLPLASHMAWHINFITVTFSMHSPFVCRVRIFQELCSSALVILVPARIPYGLVGCKASFM